MDLRERERERESPTLDNVRAQTTPEIQESVIKEMQKAADDQRVGDVQKSIDSLIKKHNITKNKSYGDKEIVLYLYPSQIDVYIELQNQIAALIPDEGDRPTIKLTVGNRDSRYKKTIGIFGGTGPLSDSKLIEHIINSNSIDWTKIEIHLLSCPPPRTVLQTVNHTNYLSQAIEMASAPHSLYYLASNTAHLNLSKVDFLVRHYNPIGGKLVDLADYVADEVKKKDLFGKDHIKNVLILGTIAGYKGNLYPSYLTKKGFQEGGPTCKKECYNVVGSKEKAERLQDFIDMAKGGSVDKAGGLIANFIAEELRESASKGIKPDAIILGCTELPMALSKKLTEAIKESYSRYSDEPLDFINTEELFAEKIIKDIQFIIEREFSR